MIAKAENVSGTEYKKFMFDTDFDDLPSFDEVPSDESLISPLNAEAPEEMSEPEPEPEPEVPTFSEDDLNRAREQSMAEGRQQGIDEAASATEKQIGDGLDTMIKQVDILFEAQAQANQDLTTNAVSVAAALVRKLFPTLNEQTALDQVEAMLRNALEQLGGTPEIKVVVPSELAEAVHDRIETLASVAGLRGDLKVVGDEGLAVGDCRLEWARGGVMRSAEELARDLDDIIDRNLMGSPEAEAKNEDVLTDDRPDAPSDASAATPTNTQSQPTETANSRPNSTPTGAAPLDDETPAAPEEQTASPSPSRTGTVDALEPPVAEQQIVAEEEAVGTEGQSVQTETADPVDASVDDTHTDQHTANAAEQPSDESVDTDAVWAGLAGDDAPADATDAEDETQTNDVEK